MGIDFSNLSLPFDVSDLISSGNGLLELVGKFVLIGLVFYFTPLIQGLVTKALSGGNVNGKAHAEREYREHLVSQRRRNRKIASAFRR
ncbi:hypothetical protein [Gracilibacillus lacisalsi]|uniref:hypothetical protein n=1 Tax=Gracilibacillus lacisalsi TaxID=393087 RepID=UPI000381F655|nr:hypothetical protein [Gracilibacillus lacisalsi]